MGLTPRIELTCLLTPPGSLLAPEYSFHEEPKGGASHHRHPSLWRNNLSNIIKPPAQAQSSLYSIRILPITSRGRNG